MSVARVCVLDHRWLAGLVNTTLSKKYNICLVGGAAEPLYLPAGSGPAVIRYTRDHASSVLHELAHWTLAGRERRTRIDYGYSYVQPPRNLSEQRTFYQGEERVQAMELLFARACDLPFQISADDLDADADMARAFARRVQQRARDWSRGSLPPRAAEILRILNRFQRQRGGPCRHADDHAGFAVGTTRVRSLPC